MLCRLDMFNRELTKQNNKDNYEACASKDQQLDGKLVKDADVHTAFLTALTFFYARVTTAEGYINA